MKFIRSGNYTQVLCQAPRPCQQEVAEHLSGSALIDDFSPCWPMSTACSLSAYEFLSFSHPGCLWRRLVTTSFSHFPAFTIRLGMAVRYSKDQPLDFSNCIEKWPLMGYVELPCHVNMRRPPFLICLGEQAGGQFGKHITEHLLKTGKHVVMTTTRPSSTNKLPKGVQVARVDYGGDDDSALVKALREQQAFDYNHVAGGSKRHHQQAPTRGCKDWSALRAP
jgi:hypothetical protein